MGSQRRPRRSRWRLQCPSAMGCFRWVVLQRTRCWWLQCCSLGCGPCSSRSSLLRLWQLWIDWLRRGPARYELLRRSWLWCCCTSAWRGTTVPVRKCWQSPTAASSSSWGCSSAAPWRSPTTSCESDLLIQPKYGFTNKYSPRMITNHRRLPRCRILDQRENFRRLTV